MQETVRVSPDQHGYAQLRHSQRNIASSRARFKIVACGRRWGKTTLGIALALRSASKGRRVWWVAPTYELAADPWRAFKARLEHEWVQKTESNRRIDLKNGGSITVKTAANATGLRGVGIDFLVVDEAAFMPEEVWQNALRPTLTSTYGSALFLSTPYGRNWFHNLYQMGKDGLNPAYKSWHRPTSGNPLILPEEIEEVKRSLPERVFRQEYEAEFLEDGGVVFRNVRRAAVAPLDMTPQPGHSYAMGVDFARYVDFTVCTVIDMDTRTMVAMDRFSGVEWSLQRARIKALADKWKVYSVLAEVNSMGLPNFETLRDMGLPMAEFNTNTATKPELIENLVLALENTDLLIQPDPVLVGELETFTYHRTVGGYTQYGAQSGRHDDTVISLALAWKAATNPRLTLGTGRA